MSFLGPVPKEVNEFIPYENDENVQPDDFSGKKKSFKGRNCIFEIRRCISPAKYVFLHILTLI